MRIELDGIQLDSIKEGMGGISDGRSVSSISAADKRNIVSHDAPGAAGSSHYDQGRSAVVISFEGTIFGENARTIVEQIRSRFKSGEAVPFIADLAGMAEITKVIIDRLSVKDSEGAKDRYEYSIVLKEYREPPEEPEAPETGADEEARAWADQEASRSDKGVNVVTGKVLGADGRPVEGVRLTIRCSDGEHSVETDGDGVYRLENLPPGEYTVLVGEGERKEYAGIEKKLYIGKGQA
jgi:hypothetical protein